MSHPFGKLLEHYRMRKPGLSQAKLAAQIGYDASLLGKMAQGKRELTGPSGRSRVLRIVSALHEVGALTRFEEANALLEAAGMPPLYDGKDEEAVLIMQLRATTPTLTTARHNLPAQWTSLVGRSEQASEIASRLRHTRLLTLIGVGGVGKTRLALEVGTQTLSAGSFADGVWWVELAAVSDLYHIAPTILNVFGLMDAAGRTPIEQLQAHLGPRQMLLVLDNCEHLLDGCAGLVDGLLHACPLLRVLCTSREPLNLTGESLWPVPPLLNAAAVELFNQRAQNAQPSFSPGPEQAKQIEHICRRLDGLPLAIELAASRLKGLSLDQIAERLDDRFRLLTGGSRTALPRHQTLRATLDWSYDLLTPAEQMLLRRMAVFVGGCTADAVEAVCRFDEEAIWHDLGIIDLLAQLVQRSLVIVDPHGTHPRYNLLESMRAYGLDKLRQSNELGLLRRRHAHWVANFVESAQAHEYGTQRQYWFRLLTSNDGNLRVALQWSETLNVDDIDALIGARIAAALRPYWSSYAQFAEAIGWLKNALRLVGNTSPYLRTRLLLTIVEFEIHQLSPIEPLTYLVDECQTLSNLTHDVGLQIEILLFRADLEWAKTGNFIPHYPRYVIEALALARKHDQKILAGVCLLKLSNLHFGRDHRTALPLLKEALEIAKETGDIELEAHVMLQMADLAGSSLELDQSAELAEAVLQLSYKFGQSGLELWAIRQLGEVMRFRGQFDQARESYEEMYRLSLLKSDVIGIVRALTMLGLLARDQGQLEAAIDFFHESIKNYNGSFEGATTWLNSIGLASVATLQGHWHRAAILFGASSQCAINGFYENLHNHFQFWSFLVHTRGKMGEVSFEAAYGVGQAMKIDEAVAYALSDRDAMSP